MNYLERRTKDDMIPFDKAEAIIFLREQIAGIQEAIDKDYPGVNTKETLKDRQRKFEMIIDILQNN